MTAGFQPDFAGHGFRNLSLKIEVIEDRLFLGIEMDAAQKLWKIASDEFPDSLIIDFGVDPQMLDIPCEVVADRAKDQIQVAVQEGGSLQPLFLIKNFFPRRLKKLHIGAQLLIRNAFAHSAHDVALSRLAQLLHQLFEPRALLVLLDAPGNPDMIDVGHENQVPPRQ